MSSEGWRGVSCFIPTDQPAIVPCSLSADSGLFPSVPDMGTSLNAVTALHSTGCANYVPHSLPGSSLIPSFADPISILQTLELLGLDRRWVAAQAWGLLELFLPVEDLPSHHAP